MDKENTDNRFPVRNLAPEPWDRHLGMRLQKRHLVTNSLSPPTAHTSHLGLFLKGNTIHGKAGGVQSSERSLQAMNRGLELSLTILSGLLTLLPAGLLDQHLHHDLLCFKEARGEGK